MYDTLSEGTKRDFVNLFCGGVIAQGSSRRVYEHALDPTLVVKIEVYDDRRFPNVNEYRIWNLVNDHFPALTRWFAPCIAISPYGSVLIQKKTSPLVSFPSRLPGFLEDVKFSNFGVYDGRVVMHDYANCRPELDGFRNWKWVKTSDIIHNGEKPSSS